jgi:uncharacterized membrane protein YqjE
VSAGLLGSVRALLDTLLGLARTRLELFGTELQAELVRLYFAAVGASVVLLLATLGLAFTAAAGVMALSEEYRALGAALAGLAFLALAFAAAWSLRRLTQAKPRLLAASLAELDRDRAALSL